MTPSESGGDLVDESGAIDLRTLHIIQAIDREGSVTAAAAALGSSQPALSQHLRRAEARLGVPLIKKEGRTARLSEAGRVLLYITPGMTQALDYAAARLRELRSLREERLRMRGFAAATAALLPRLLSALRQTHPDAQLSYVECSPMAALRDVAAEDADLAIVYQYPRSTYASVGYDAEAFEFHKLFRDAFHVALPAGHPLASRHVVALSSLDEEEWVLPAGEHGRSLSDIVLDARISPTGVVRTDNANACLSLIGAGHGVALLTELELRSTRPAGNVVIRRTEPAFHRTISAAVPRNNPASDLAEHAIRTLRALRIANDPTTAPPGEHRLGADATKGDLS